MSRTGGPDRLLVRDLAQLVTPAGREAPLRGRALGEVEILEDAYLLTEGGLVAAGATWVSVHHGGGVGIGNSIHAGMVVLADGTDSAAERLERVLTADPGMGVVRHLDAGCDEAESAARELGFSTPMFDASA